MSGAPDDIDAVWNDEGEDHDLVAVSGQGGWLTDQHGRRLYEGVSGHSCLNLGHANEELIEAAAASFRRLSYASPEHLTAPVAQLSATLARLLGGDYRIKYATTGGGANELAIDIARRHWRHCGRGTKRTVLSLDRSYHGSSGAAGLASGIAVLQSRHADQSPEFMTVAGPRDLATGLNRSLSALRAALTQAIEDAGPDTVAALIVEPVGFAGGMVIPPEGFLEMVAAVCRRFDILTIVDEIITGFGRSGRWFGFQHAAGFVPDMVTLGKGITSAYYPLSAVAVQAAIYASFATAGNALSKLITMAGHPVGCDIALKTIAIIERDDLVGQVARNAETLSRLGALREVRGVRDVRGLGHMWGIEFAGTGPDAVAAGCVLAEAVRRACLARGLIVLRIENVLRLNPPLVATPDEIAFVVDTVVDEVSALPAA